MDKILNIDTVSDYNKYWGLPDRHPFVNVLEGSQITKPIPNCRKYYGLYTIFLKDVKCADYQKYGCNEYDYQENTLVFVSPGQVFGYPADGSTYQAKGWCLYCSPELLRGTSLGRHIKDYTFFSYDVKEALHLSPNYFGDLIKKETGKSAIEHIQRKTMDTAKDFLTQTNKTISEIAYCLGYQYPQYFSRAFKKSIGCTPYEYRQTI